VSGEGIRVDEPVDREGRRMQDANCGRCNSPSAGMKPMMRRKIPVRVVACTLNCTEMRSPIRGFRGASPGLGVRFMR
jgi:hypothetical protein